KSTSNSTQFQSSTTNPWEPAQPLLSGILTQLGTQLGSTGPTSAETGSINSIEANAGHYGQYGPMIASAVRSYLGGGGATNKIQNVQSSFDPYKAALAPYSSGAMIGGNSGLKPYLDTTANDVTANVNGQFAAAGRDLSGLNQQALARGI